MTNLKAARTKDLIAALQTALASEQELSAGLQHRKRELEATIKELLNMLAVFGRGPVKSVTCANCGNPLKIEPAAHYCSTRCRVAAHRARKRTASLQAYRKLIGANRRTRTPSAQSMYRAIAAGQRTPPPWLGGLRSAREDARSIG